MEVLLSAGGVRRFTIFQLSLSCGLTYCYLRQGGAVTRSSCSRVSLRRMGIMVVSLRLIRTPGERATEKSSALFYHNGRRAAGCRPS
ncbi:UNVERIFIED_CONTAM: hypothetical protein Sradi_0321200 [Sesamum radiatum]|uniref:Uncharacterized protein n=1 Tax=Sesamum radiatum TaxID=300843 RepID=A0AAW2W433_SESRA